MRNELINTLSQFFDCQSNLNAISKCFSQNSYDLPLEPLLLALKDEKSSAHTLRITLDAVIFAIQEDLQAKPDWKKFYDIVYVNMLEIMENELKSLPLRAMK